MPRSLSVLLASLPLMRLVRGLLLSPRPRHLRDLAARNALSPAGVSDMLKRLSRAKVLIESRHSNRRYFSLKISTEERHCLESLFKHYENYLISSRSRKFSRNAATRLEWMDETYEYYRLVKKGAE